MIRVKLTTDEVDICRRIARERNEAQTRKKAETLRMDRDTSDEGAHIFGVLGAWAACKVLKLHPQMPPVIYDRRAGDADLYDLHGRRLLIRTRQTMGYDFIMPSRLAGKKWAVADMGLLCETDPRWMTEVNLVGYLTREEWLAGNMPLSTGKGATLKYPRYRLHDAALWLPPEPFIQPARPAPTPPPTPASLQASFF